MCFNTGVINTGCPHLTSRALHNFRRALTMAALKWQRREGKAEHGRYCINCTPNPAVGCVEEKIWFWRVSLWRRRGCWYWAHAIPHMVQLNYRGWNHSGYHSCAWPPRDLHLIPSRARGSRPAFMLLDLWAGSVSRAVKCRQFTQTPCFWVLWVCPVFPRALQRSQRSDLPKEAGEGTLCPTL